MSTQRRDSGLLPGRARLSLEGTYGKRISGRITYDNKIFTGSALDSLSFQLGKELGLQTWIDADPERESAVDPRLARPERGLRPRPDLQPSLRSGDLVECSALRRER